METQKVIVNKLVKVNRSFFVFILFLSINGAFYSQDSINYDKLKEKDLIELIVKRDIEIKLKDKRNDSLVKVIGSYETEKKNIIKNNAEKINELQKSLNEFDETIKLINRTYFISKIDDFYKKKDIIFSADLLTDYNQKLYENTNLILKSVKREFKNTDTLKFCTDLENFNTNMIELQKIRNEVLSQKYDSTIILINIEKIKKLPSLNEYLKLYNSKNDLIKILENYKAKSCELYIKLEKLKKFSQADNLTMYSKLINEYDSYPYLVNILNKMKKDKSLYDEKDFDFCIPK
jgi:hypothetical protein